MATATLCWSCPGSSPANGYLQALRDWLRRAGYSPVKSGLSRNPGWSEELVAQLSDLARSEFDRGGKKVSIIGHSMGGVLARSIAVRRPDMIRQVITLGSPLGMGRSRLAESVAFTAIFSRADRVVPYPRARAHDAHAHNIEVPGSHTGMAVNGAVYRALARLLAEPASGASNDSRERNTTVLL